MMLGLMPGLALVLAASAAAAAPPPADPRYCAVSPARTASGAILRSRAVLREFKAAHPCPSTGKATGACPGWAIDHVIPLACGGCDAVVNLQWLPDVIKSASGAQAKDRWERTIYCRRVEP